MSRRSRISDQPVDGGAANGDTRGSSGWDQTNGYGDGRGASRADSSNFAPPLVPTLANLWPTWLAKNITTEQIREMLKAESNAGRCAELRTAKKLLEQAKRIKGKSPTFRPPSGGSNLRCTTPFDPVAIVIDTFVTWFEANSSGQSFWDQVQFDLDESIWGQNPLHIHRFPGDNPESL